MREAQYTAKIGSSVKAQGLYALKLALPYSSGIADSWYSGPARDLWVEYKWYATLPPVIDLRAGAQPKLSRLQQQWLEARHAEGRNVAVVVACSGGAVIFPGVTWHKAITRDEFVERAVTPKAVSEYITEFIRGRACRVS